MNMLSIAQQLDEACQEEESKKARQNQLEYAKYETRSNKTSLLRKRQSR